MSKRFLDQDALNYNPRKPGFDRHFSKHKQRDKALEIVFDPSSHKEYLTGFRKRKQARRKEALSKLEKRQRQQRLEERAERRQSMKDQLNLDDPEAEAGARADSEPGSDEEGPEPGGKKAVRVFQSGALTSTVTVAPIAVRSESETESGGASADDGARDGSAHADGHMPKPAASTRAAAQHPSASPKERYSKMTKERYSKMTECALKVMAKTRLKIEGKKATGGARGKAQEGQGVARRGRDGGAGAKRGGGKGKGRR